MSKPRDHADLDRLQDDLDLKNTYLHHYKKDEIKQVERENELTATNVRVQLIRENSSHTTKLRVKKRTTTARSASMRASGASTGRREKMPSRNWEQPLQRMDVSVLTLFST